MTEFNIFAISPEGFEIHIQLTGERVYGDARACMQRMIKDGFAPRHGFGAAVVPTQPSNGNGHAACGMGQIATTVRNMGLSSKGMRKTGRPGIATGPPMVNTTINREKRNSSNRLTAYLPPKNMTSSWEVVRAS